MIKNKKLNKIYALMVITFFCCSHKLFGPPPGSNTHVVPTPTPSPAPTPAPVPTPGLAITDITSQSVYISSNASVVALRPIILSYLSEKLESEISYQLPENTHGLQLGYLPVRQDNALPIQTIFTNFYNQIVSGTALSYSINTDTGPTTHTAPAFSYSSLLNSVLPLFVTTDNGQYYGYAFVSGSLPLQILSDMQTEIVTYAQLAMDNITYLNYATTDGINFVGNGTFFATTPLSGTVAPQYQVQNSAGCIPAPQPSSSSAALPDSHIAQLNNFFNGQLFTTFSNSFNSNQSLFSGSSSVISSSGAQQNYTNIYNNYLYQLSNNVAHWGFALIAKLALNYNAQVYFNGVNGIANANAEFNGIPNVPLLDNYGALTITAINQLASIAQTMNLTLVPPSGVQLYNNLGDIAGYAGFRSLELAASYVAGTATPPSTSASTGIPVQNNQPIIDPQTTVQQLQTALTLNNKTVGQVQPSVDPAVILQAVVESIINAYQYFSLAQSYYSQAQNNVMIGFYQEKVSSLQKLTDSIEQVSTDMGNVSPLSATSSSDDLASFVSKYNDIQNNFDLVAQAFYQMGQSGLGLYFQKLSAQAGIGEYQQILTTLSAWYSGTLTSYGISNSGGYINYANAEPIVNVANWEQYAGNALDQESNFQTLITYLQQQVAQASLVYAQELSFYSALGSNLSPDDQKIMADLYATVQIFEHLSKGLAGMGYLQDILGQNYQTATDFSDVITTIMASENMFIDALNELAQADALIAKATPGVLDYVQVHNIFANQDSSIYTPKNSDGLPTITTFYNLAYVHRARLCYHAGQILAAKQEPMALYLLWASVGLYNQLSATDANADNPPYSWALNNQSWVNTITIASFINSNSTLFNTLFNRATALSTSIGSLTAATDISAAYQQLMMIYFTLFSTDSDSDVSTAVDAFYQDANNALSWYKSAAGQTVPYANLMQAMINYQVYLMCMANGDFVGNYLSNAQQLLTAFKVSNQIDSTANATPIVIPQSPTDLQFQQLSAQLQAQTDSLLALQQASIDQAVLQAYYYDLPGTVTALDFSVANIDFNQQLGDLYFNYATSLLTRAKNNFNAGTSYNLNNNDTYTTIITTYQQAIEYYNQAGNTASSLKAQQAMSSAVGWQLYSMVIPVNMCDLATMAGNASVLGDILPASCQADSAITASYSANPTWPQFVLNYSEILIPTGLVNGVDLVAVAQQYLNKTVTNPDILTNLVAPLKTNIYTQLVDLVGQSQVQFTNCTGTVSACIGQLVAQDMAQAQALLSGAVKTSSGVVLQSSYSVVQKQDPTSGVTGYYLIGNNVPLPAMPRFSGEITTAMFYYSQGALPIFSPGTQPVNISGQLLLPAPDATAVTTVNAALFNANYLTLLALQAQLNSALASSTYTQLKACSGKDLLAMTQNASQLTIYQNFYTYSLAPVLTNLLATYDYVADFASALTSYPQLENFIRAQEVNAYMNWISIEKQFLFGDPTALLDHNYKDCLDGIIDLYNQALDLFLNGVATNQAIALNNQLVNEVCTILENTGDLLVTLPGNIPSIAYPTSTSSYPVIPAGATFNKWYDAAIFYSGALGFYQNNYQAGYDAGGNPTYSMPTDSGLRLYSKQCLALYNDAIFRLAVFGNNAFTECKCKLYTGTYNAPVLDASGNPVVPAQTKALSLTNAFEAAAIAQQVEPTSSWMQNLDTTINTLVSPNFQGNYVCDTTGSGASLTPVLGVSQGVITQLTPAFKEFLLAAKVGCSTSTFNGGPGCGTNAQDAGTLMQQQYMVQALSSLSLLSSVSSPNSPVPMQAISNIMNLSNKITETPSAINQYLCGTFTQDATTQAITVTSSGIFNSHPGFATDADIAASVKDTTVPLPYPAISIINVDSKGVFSTQSIVIGSAYTESILASTNIFYTPTIEYWSSLPRFLQDLQKPVSLWFGNPYDPNFTPIDPATFNAWVSSLNAVAINMYGNIYYPFSTESDLYQTAYNDMQNLSQSNNSQAGQYVG